MKLYLIPPHGDFSITVPNYDGWQVVDLGRQFVEAVLDKERLEALAKKMEAERQADDPLDALLQLKAAAALMDRPTDFHGRLRVLGAALSGLTAEPAPINLRLDDLELHKGTTESSADLLASIASEEPVFQAQLEAVLETCNQADQVRIRLNRDQQLPALFILAQRLVDHPRLEVAGRFSRIHQKTLSQMPLMKNVRFVDDDGPTPWILAGLPGTAADGSPIAWVHDDTGETTVPDGPWAGSASLEAIADPTKLIASGCTMAVVGFCALTDSGISLEGKPVSMEALRAGYQKLKQAGVRVVAEWWIGAPGIHTAQLDDTQAQLLQGPPFFDWLAGLRWFSWVVQRPVSTWSGVPVTLGDPEANRDLARYRPFSAPDTLTGEQISQAMARYKQDLVAKAPMSPGRIAAAYLAVAPISDSETPGVALDSDCAVFAVHIGDPAQPVWYAVNLRSGVVLKMDGRLAAPIQSLHGTKPLDEAFATLPAAQREAIKRALIKKTILREVSP